MFPGLGTGLQAKIKQLFNKTDSYPYPYPGWLNPEFEKKLNLKKKWSEKWREPARGVHGRHPVIYKHLLTPDWNTDDVYMNTDFTLSEKRDPFLDPRLVEFVLSLPAVPWLFKKHLLRKYMHGVLPEEITRRPKAVLGDIHTSLLRQAESKDINYWPVTQEILCYIDRTGVPWLNGRGCDTAGTYVNLRPFLLNSWLQELQK